jgi:photosystem II PsbY protein
MDIDFRIAIVLAPLVLAASWAVFNIFRAAAQQVQIFMNKGNN